jgi:hypothetical protein
LAAPIGLLLLKVFKTLWAVLELEQAGIKVGASFAELPRRIGKELSFGTLARSHNGPLSVLGGGGVDVALFVLNPNGKREKVLVV